MSTEEGEEAALGVPYEPLPSIEDGEIDTPELAGAESYEWEAHSNLDSFFNRVYRYWQGKGFYTIILREVLNLVALLFTVAFSGFLLLFVHWGALRKPCISNGTCDIITVVIKRNPLEGESPLWSSLKLLYLIIFSLYWSWTLALFLFELPGLLDVKRLCNYRLGVSERQIKWLSWPELVYRLVRVQHKTRLCNVRDLTEHDIIMRVMRRENYLIGMLNKGVLALNVPVPGWKRQFLLTKTLEWNIYWCILNTMFDDKFRVKERFKHDVLGLQRRFRWMAVANFLLAPFVFVFLMIYFLLKNAEKFYHTPSNIGARNWTPLAHWRLREFNEMPHFVEQRLNASREAATKYVDQFPSYSMVHVANLISYIVGSFTALVLLLALVDDTLLERQLMGRNLVWWGAVFTVFLRVSRGLAPNEEAFDPEGAMAEVTKNTHYLPRHWRGRAHSKEVQEQFRQLFQYKAQIFLNELSSVVLTPFVLYFTLPKCAESILSFVTEFTVYESGVGDTCSLASFDFKKHGNKKYGAVLYGDRNWRSKQGKMEKSFLTFVISYPTWAPPEAGRTFLSNLIPYAPSLQYQYPCSSQYIGYQGKGMPIGSQMQTSSWVWDFSGLADSGEGGTVPAENLRRVGGSDPWDVKKSLGSMRQSQRCDKARDQDSDTVMSTVKTKQRRTQGGGLQSGRQGFQVSGIEMLSWHSSMLPSEQKPLQDSPHVKPETYGDTESDRPPSPDPKKCSQKVVEKDEETLPSGRRVQESGDQRIPPGPIGSGAQSLCFDRMNGFPASYLANSFESWSASHQFTGLDSKLIESHWMLQNYYHGHEDTVQHRLAHRMSQLGGSWVHWATVPDS